MSDILGNDDSSQNSYSESESDSQSGSVSRSQSQNYSQSQVDERSLSIIEEDEEEGTLQNSSKSQFVESHYSEMNSYNSSVDLNGNSGILNSSASQQGLIKRSGSSKNSDPGDEDHASGVSRENTVKTKDE